MPDQRRNRNPRRCVVFRMPRQRAFLSHLEMAQVRYAGFHHGEVHFDEIVFYAAGFCGGEDFFPVERAFPNRHDFFRVSVPALDMHRDEAARIFVEIFGGIEAFADGGDLELEFDELGIEQGRTANRRCAGH